MREGALTPVRENALARPAVDEIISAHQMVGTAVIEIVARGAETVMFPRHHGLETATGETLFQTMTPPSPYTSCPP